jgi:probable phosphoglycerate mutase
MELWLVRHGPTEWSLTGKHTSITDVALTPDGEEVARRLADRLAGEEFGLVLTSPRQRARRTAELTEFPEAHVEDDLVEWSYGDYEGLTNQEIRRTVPGWTLWTHPCPGGETPEQVSARLDRVVAKVRAYAGCGDSSEEGSGDSRALVFGHGHSLRALAARWIEQPVTDGRFFRLDTATVSILGYERETPVVLRWNS